MLRLENIVKDYVMKGSEVHALKGLNLNFRSNEFVSILGPSGCGKTTLLNILGGLDQYTSGDLVIDGKSTKDFKDHDWDVYRNHRIGFIFQSYNLIPHENILENVELALTIAGVSKEERTRRAQEALDQVGLKGMYKKKPNQLSGGQCQRVAIARALVNEPEILLADEPTGALDSITSVQIMELIKEISKNKLVIMVTHNPDLAHKYSTRIVELLDGSLVNDSNPYSTEEEIQETQARHSQPEEEKEKAKMSWWTAFKLSAKNLLSKAKRTSLVIIAASIGIIGVSAVMSVSSGVSGYIDGMQDEMLSGNPIQVAQETFDLSSITSSMSTSQQTETVQKSIENGKVNVDYMTERLITSAKQMGTSMIENDITQDYLDFVKGMPSEYYKDVVMKYGIDITNNIYTNDNITGYDDNTVFSLSGITEIATAVMEKKLADGGYSSYASMISSYAGTFAQSLNSESYIKEQYDVLTGKVATAKDEIMIVVSDDQELTDFTLTLLGYYSQDEFLKVIEKYNTESGEPDESVTIKERFTYDELLGKKFTYYPNDVVFTKNNSTSSTSQKERPFYYSFMENQEMKDSQKGMDLKVVGILKPKEGRQYSSLSTGFYYTPAFSEEFIKQNKESQLASFLNDYLAQNPDSSGYSTTYMPSYLDEPQGIYYQFDYYPEDKDNKMSKYALLGTSSSMSSILSLFSGGSGLSANVATLSLASIGASDIPTKINFYPNSFVDKYLVTDYLDQWNVSSDLTLASGKVLKASDRDEIKYTDNLSIIIGMINNVINIITIALISFTALSLVVSTVMIAIITYVSVMERIKEIGIIRALGGRKKDVSHLFNAETFMIGLASGLFGIAFTYLLQTILNVTIHAIYPAISSIAALSPLTALIVILVSILLTTIAGLIPSSSAARKDPVVALRTE